jgi:hypothetical protein
MVSYSDDHHGTVAFLEPKGISVMPKTILEVLQAVSCILDALMVSLLSALYMTLSSRTL